MDDNLISKIVSETLSQQNASCITLKKAQKLSKRVMQKAEEIGVKVVVAISNTSARPVLVECMDNSYIASYDIALNKAYTVVALKMATKELKKLANPGGELYGIQFSNNGQIIVFGGGNPLIYNEKIIGGLGVSGGTEEQDTFLSDYGASILTEIMKGD